MNLNKKKNLARYMSEDKKIVEAILFAIQEGTEEEIARRSKVDKRNVRRILNELKEEYKDRGIRIEKDGEIWRFTVVNEALNRISKLIPPELNKALTETLGVIAAGRPIKQSDVIKIRGNKAYDHIKKLEKLGFFSSKKEGKTVILDITEKFFKYFDISKEDLNKIFSGIRKEFK